MRPICDPRQQRKPSLRIEEVNRRRWAVVSGKVLRTEGKDILGRSWFVVYEREGLKEPHSRRKHDNIMAVS